MNPTAREYDPPVNPCLLDKLFHKKQRTVTETDHAVRLNRVRRWRKRKGSKYKRTLARAIRRWE